MQISEQPNLYWRQLTAVLHEVRDEAKSLLTEFWGEGKQARRTQWENPSLWELLVLILPLTLLIFVTHENSKRAEIAQRQTSASAVVTVHDPPNHGRYGYSFLVNGKTVTGRAYPHDGTDYSIGELIVVYYDPLDPSENSSENYNKRGAGYYAAISFVLLAFIGISLQFYFRWRTYKTPRRKTSHS